MEPELIDAIGGYLLAHVERHGHARTTEAFGVSRHTLWRFLERGQPGRALPRAVVSKVGDTPGKLAAATRALRSEAHPAPSERPRPARLTQALHETLLLVCETPFASVEDLSRLKRVPASTLRERLAKLRGLGLTEAHPHRVAMLSDRPLRRHVPTPAGVAALGDDDLLYRHPVSRQWLRLLAERLDGVALVYELAALIADADPEQEPVRVQHCRRGPYDALVTLSGGRTLGVVRQGPLLSAASLRYRIRTIERMGVQELPHVTLVATDSDQDTRRAVRALREPSGFHHSAVATLGAVIGRGARARVWQPARYGRGNALDLVRDRAARARRGAQHGRALSLRRRRHHGAPPAPCRLEDSAQAVIAATVKVETPEATGSAFHIGNGEFVTAAHLVDGEPDAITLRNERVDATAVVAGWVRLVDACGRVVGVASWKFAQENRGVATDGLAFFIAEPSLGAALERIREGDADGTR